MILTVAKRTVPVSLDSQFICVKEELTIAVLMRFVITPKDPTTAHVNQDMKGTEIIAQVIFFVL